MTVAWPKGHRSQWHDLVDQIRRPDLIDLFDAELPPEVQTDKELVKILPCQYCKRPLVVTTFYVLAWAKCSPCKGETGPREAGSVDVVQAGRTPPHLAADLSKLLLNPHFAFARCPVHPDDEEHEMELKSVNHNEHYGPGEWVIDKKGHREWRQTGPGETVMHQCLRCRAIVTYSNTAQTQFRRVNEIGSGKHANGWDASLGSREEEPVA